jgi:hypothetical protein
VNGLDAEPAGFADETVIVLEITPAGKAKMRIDKLEDRLENGFSNIQSSI